MVFSRIEAQLQTNPIPSFSIFFFLFILFYYLFILWSIYGFFIVQNLRFKVNISQNWGFKVQILGFLSSKFAKFVNILVFIIKIGQN